MSDQNTRLDTISARGTRSRSDVRPSILATIDVVHVSETDALCAIPLHQHKSPTSGITYTCPGNKLRRNNTITPFWLE